MLRDQPNVLINDILVGLEESASAYRADAEATTDPESAKMLRALADRRSRQAERLEGCIRMSGNLPDTLDQDREAVERWSEQLLSESRRIRRHGRNDGKLQAQITQALGLQWPQELHKLLESLGLEISEDRQRLLDRFG